MTASDPPGLLKKKPTPLPMEAAMKTRTMIALAAALTSAPALFTSSAEAGMGVRLGFGGPLGSFVARPSGGGAYQPAYTSSRGYGSPTCDRTKAAIAARREREEAALRRRKIMEAAAERREKLAAIAAAKREKLAEAAAAAKREKLAEAAAERREKLAEAAAERREKLATRQAEANKAEKAETSAPVSSVLVAKATTGTPDVAPAPAEATINLEDAPETTAKAKPVKKKAEVPTAATSTEPSAKALDCKMFVPSAGVTVSVPCKE
jgi:hypothetical protein